MKKEQRILYIIVGASGSGKTTLLQHIVYTKKLCSTANKYSSRELRPSDRDVNNAEISDDITPLPILELEKKCDILYEINDNKYGVNSIEIIDSLDNNMNGLMLVMSDIRAIKILKKKVEYAGHLVKVIFLLSRMDSVTEFVRTWQSRVLDEFKSFDNKSLDRAEIEKINSRIRDELLEYLSIINSDLSQINIELVSDCCSKITNLLPQSVTYRKRSEKIRLTFTQYVYNIGLFDYVILNTTTKEDMFTQAERIIFHNYDVNIQRLPKHKRIKGPVVFLVCASPKSGKGTLMENLNIMGVSQIQITPKYANRDPASNDKRDGMIALGKAGFEAELTKTTDEYWEWTFHVMPSGGGTKYAVKRADIVDRLNKGICQIFVSNFEQLERVLSTRKNDDELLKVLDGIKDRLVLVYLHRVRTADETNEQVVDEMRRREVSLSHQQYINNITKIDHVIINPNHLTYSEDLHDQMMSLIELYQH